jgi:hypothetical protein
VNCHTTEKRAHIKERNDKGEGNISREEEEDENEVA